MFDKKQQERYYQALLDKDANFEGLFFVGVKTTGIFCRPSCPARKPKFENCEFLPSIKSALFANYRPCERCKPLEPPTQYTPLIKQLIECVNNAPEKRWTNEDLRKLNIDPSTARRQFQRAFKMSFIEYARAKRLGIAMKTIKAGKQVIEAQFDAHYESSSGFRDAFSKIMGAAPTKSEQKLLMAQWIDTPLGPMLAIADDEALYLLEFTERRALEKEIEDLRKKHHAGILPGHTAVLKQIKKELEDYFAGKSLQFKTPLKLTGSDFQQTVWRALMKIPPGETQSYAQLAKTCGNPKGFRAAANANGRNQLAIIIPCHRVINADGELGGYGGGIDRKMWLLNHEKEYSKP